MQPFINWMNKQFTKTALFSREMSVINKRNQQNINKGIYLQAHLRGDRQPC